MQKPLLFSETIFSILGRLVFVLRLLPLATNNHLKEFWGGIFDPHSNYFAVRLGFCQLSATSWRTFGLPFFRIGGGWNASGSLPSLLGI